MSKLTARKVAELLAMHMVSRDIACIKPDVFDKQSEVFDQADDQSKALIQYFEDHRRHLLEAIGEEHPEVLDAI
ncbi:hypothetical protein [Endozoicomonas numazuensis]|uniref:Uncharacterized protein n=1 Tax=Endozoicomonas numazuensis TaxID=1137799 RepID=A0A081NL65_9GAMM|nr:hypothetical protein [Endozoicomonas numazuensis]KEQ19188.1 hypothetical protein GZ78_04120 [Endozoicomonas numazuensis]